MSTWNCTECTTPFSVGAKCCPNCGATEVREDGIGVRSAIVELPAREGEIEVRDTHKVRYELEPLDTSNAPAATSEGTGEGWTPATKRSDINAEDQ